MPALAACTTIKMVAEASAHVDVHVADAALEGGAETGPSPHAAQPEDAASSAPRSPEDAERSAAARACSTLCSSRQAALQKRVMDRRVTRA